LKSILGTFSDLKVQRQDISMSVFFDIETTGLSPVNDRIVSIAASCGDEKFFSYVNPLKLIPPRASAVNGIYDDDVKDAPSWQTVGSEFFEFVHTHCGDCPTFVAYNGKKFDIPFIMEETKRTDIILPFKEIYICDPLFITRANLPELKSKKLGCVYEHLFSEPIDGAHNADVDTAALRRVCDHPSISSHLEMYTYRVVV